MTEKRPAVSDLNSITFEKSTPWYQDLLDHLDHLVAVLDINGYIIHANRTAVQFAGLSLDALAGRPIWDLSLWQEPELKTIIQTAVQKSADGEHLTRETTLSGADGLPHVIELSVKPVADANGKVLYLLAEGKDITHQKQTEEALRTRDHLLNIAISGAPVILWVMDADGTFRFSAGRGTQSIREILPDPIGKSVYDLYANYPQVIKNIQRGLSGESFEDWVIVGDLYYYTQYSPIRNDQGETIGLVGISTDMSSQKQAEEALRQSQALFETIFKVAGIGIVLKDLEGYMTNCNPAFEKMLGYLRDELKNHRYLDVTYEEDVPISRYYYQQLIEGNIDGYNIDKRYISKDGRIVWARMTATLMRTPDNKPQYVIGMVEDITSRKELEAELVEVQRRLMQARENERLRLAQDLHDGPLQDIVGLNFTLQNLYEHQQKPEQQNELTIAIDNLKNISSTVRAICTELRPPALAPFGLEKAIRSHADTFRNAHPDLELYLALTPDGQILSESTRLALYRIFQESLNNILRHAQAKHVWVRLLLDEEQAVMEVQDDGQGFRVPKRWVTLARQGHLGLVGSVERIQSISGRLEIESEPGKGTLIRAIVPIKHDV